MSPQKPYRYYTLTVQSTRGDAFSSRQMQSALGEMQQLLTNMCYNFTAQFGVKSKDAKCIQMDPSGGDSGRHRESSAQVALKRLPTNFSSLPGRHQHQGISRLKKSLCTTKSFCWYMSTQHSCPHQSLKEKQELCTQIFMKFLCQGVKHTHTDLLLNTYLF